MVSWSRKYNLTCVGSTGPISTSESQPQRRTLQGDNGQGICGGFRDRWACDSLAWSHFASVVGEEAKNTMTRPLIREVLEENRIQFDFFILFFAMWCSWSEQGLVVLGGCSPNNGCMPEQRGHQWSYIENEFTCELRRKKWVAEKSHRYAAERGNQCGVWMEVEPE